jgi:hypothetical protein
VVETGVRLALSGVDGVGGPCGWVLRRTSDHGEEWAEEACPKLDEKNAEFQADWSQTIVAPKADRATRLHRGRLIHNGLVRVGRGGGALAAFRTDASQFAAVYRDRRRRRGEGNSDYVALSADGRLVAGAVRTTADVRFGRATQAVTQQGR